MIKNIFKVLIVSLLIFAISNSNIYAYSDDYFEFDVPEKYGTFNYSSITMLVSSDKTGRVVILMSKEQEYSSIRTIWDLDDNQIDFIVSQLGQNYKIINSEDRAKLGKEKAIKLTATDDGSYVELYLLLSKGHIHAVAFSANSALDLDNEDFDMIKKSFKLKGSTNTSQNVFIVAAISIITTMLILYIREKNSQAHKNAYYYGNRENNMNSINNSYMNNNDEFSDNK